MQMNSEIIIVSGLPRSGTSLMMQMLEGGGLEMVTDNIRSADTDNPRGYFEFEKVKRIKKDASWLPAARGKAFKMVSQLLYDLPPSERYAILFMERDLEEMLLSQEKMLRRLGRTSAPHEEMRQSFTLHLEGLHQWLRHQPHFEVLCVSYNELVARPEIQATRVREFLRGRVNVPGMVQAVDLSLYRNRKDPSDRSNDAVTGSTA
jgi:hypothetical protein